MSEPTLLDAALAYAARGWHVFPCHTPTPTGCSCRTKGCADIGKHPRTQHGLKEATTEESTIARWWRQWPQANIGIATGQGSGLGVLDVDDYKGGNVSLRDLEQSYAPLPETMQQLTGGGGAHFFFAHPGTPVKNGVESIGAGLDIRGDGGYVIAPPSLHASGTRYVWEISHEPDDTPLAPMPAWLLALCQTTTRRDAPDAGAPIAKGSRNDTLFRLGCSLRAKGLTEAVILAALREMNLTQCQPPLTEEEIGTLAASCAQYAPGTSREDYQQHRNGTGTVAEDAPDEDDTQADPRPRIDITPDITRMVDQGQAALMGLPKGPHIFQRARQLCLIAHGVTPPKWMHRPLDTPVILDASPRYLEELATQAAVWAKWDARAKAWKEAVPPPRFVETLLGRPGWPFPVLEGIIQSPTLRPDGSLLDTPGYDVDTGLYLDCNGTAFPPLPTHPTVDDARSAIGRLQEAVQNFPFTKDEQEQDGPGFSATLAAILTLVCRFAIAGNVPLFAIRATTRGSGKSLLVDVMSIIGTGRAAPRWPQVTEEDEERKRLLTVALAGYQAVHIDNVTRPLGSPALDMALTSSTISDRILGQNASKEVPNVLVWFASGNNMMFKGDTARRVVPIDLDPKMERPEERTGFVHDPLLSWIAQERPRLAMAALTILKAYFAAGTPAQDLPQMGSFEQWSRLIRHALVWAGEQDPCAGRQTLEAESDPEFERLATLLTAWEACYEHAPNKLQAVLDDIRRHAQHVGPDATRNMWNDLQDALGACDPKYDGKAINSGPVGYQLRKWEGRTIAGKRFVNKNKGGTNLAQWYVQDI